MPDPDEYAQMREYFETTTYQPPIPDSERDEHGLPKVDGIDIDE